jgi:hypothetical protein
MPLRSRMTSLVLVHWHFIFITFVCTAHEVFDPHYRFCLLTGAAIFRSS